MASKAGAVDGWRAGRRQSACDLIVDAAWELVRENGLASLSLRDLATRAGITTPTVYTYFDSKNAIFDAMFHRAASEFDDRMAMPYSSAEPREIQVEAIHRFADFCTSDVARYQLLFQRTIPGFEPSAESYAPAVRALEGAQVRLARSGITEARHLDMWTALVTGLVDQQISNDPGGERWIGLIDESVAMFLRHCDETAAPAKRARSRATTGLPHTTMKETVHDHQGR